VLADGIPSIIPIGTINGNKSTMPSVVSMNTDQKSSQEISKEYFSIVGDDLGIKNIFIGQEAVDVHVDALERIEQERNHKGSKSSDNIKVDGIWNYQNFKRIMGVGCTTAANNSFGVVPNLSLISTLSDEPMGKQKRKRLEHLSLNKKLEEATLNPAKLSFENDTYFTPEQISALILRKLFYIAELDLKDKVTRAVIGVPAYFNDAQREATIEACKLAGVSRVKLLREPEAAALAYGVGKDQAAKASGKEKDTDDELVLVFDLGGGTFDVSILEVGGGIMEVVATGGNNMLGGSDFDARISEYFVDRMTKAGAKNYMKRSQNSRKDGKVASCIINSAEAVRISLSNKRKLKLALPLTADGWLDMKNPGDVIVRDKDDLGAIVANKNFETFDFTRREMEALCEKELRSLLRPIREVALLAQAMLPGDARPSTVENALKMEEEYQMSLDDSQYSFSNFFNVEGESVEQNNSDIDQATSEMLLDAVKVLDAKAMKKKQQKGRKKARSLASREKSFRNEKRIASEKAQYKNPGENNAKVRDGFGGRPISQVVLVGGATRMPAIGRLLAAMTGIVPQRTVNPDEAVALGCAIQVGLLDGNEAVTGVVEVMTPMQAAIMRAMAQKKGLV